MFNFLRFCLPNYGVLASTTSLKKPVELVVCRSAHSIPVAVSLNSSTVKVLPALSDNYMYLIIDETTREAAVVDPIEPDQIIREVKEEGLYLSKILTTHHHWDHAGGNEVLVKKYPGLRSLQVYGGDKRIGGLTNLIKHGDSFCIGNIKVECISTPCHTSGHMCYHINAPYQTPAVFTGDTLFVAGCGRFFEGNASQMYSALIEKLGGLPDNTKIFCGHEYTLKNLKFAQYVDEQNPDILKKIMWAEDKRERRLPTVPSTIAEEKAVNPFMRVMLGKIQSFAGCSSPVSTMQYLRRQKDKIANSAAASA